MVTGFPHVPDCGALEIHEAPLVPLWTEGVMADFAVVSALLRGTASSATAIRTTSDAVPFLHVPARSTELPATTVGESSRGGSLRRHKAGLWTVF